MLKETECIRPFCHIFIIGGISSGGPWALLNTLAMPMGRIYIELGPWHFGDLCNIVLPNIDEDRKKSYHLSAEPLTGTVLYCSKSGPSYCITFRKRLDEGLRYQLLGRKLSISPGLYV